MAGTVQRVTTSAIHHGDARDLQALLGLADGSVDCIVTSPPYWHLKRYADGDRREIGHQQSRDEYFEAVGEVFRQCHELAKPTGVMWLVIDTMRDPDSRDNGRGELMPLPFQLAEVARRKGWRLQDLAIWQKNKTLPYSGGGKLRNLIEYVLFLTKSGTFKHYPYRCAERHTGAEWLAGWPERYHPLGKRPSNVWQFDIDTQGMWNHSAGIHACPFPQELVARCIDLTTDKGDVVIDPFAGIGTVCAQAIVMGREAHGVELNPKNIEAFHERVLPEFKRDWAQQKEIRRLMREDQRDEALTILRLRLLKAGREMMRLIDRLAQSRTSRHPAAAVESVVVVEPDDLPAFLHFDQGEVEKPPARLVLLAELSAKKREALVAEVQATLGSPPFSTFGLDFSVEVVAFERLDDVGVPPDRLLEFGQSRHGAYTAPLDASLLGMRPRLLTTVRLTAPVEGVREDVLKRVEQQAARGKLQRELTSGSSLRDIAGRLGLPQAELYKRLLRLNLVKLPKAFAFSLSQDQLALSDVPDAEDAPTGAGARIRE